MRFAIVSDIHANMPAWKAVLTDIASNRIDRILCLGDAVGYGPQPLEVLSSLHQHVDAFCMGNHDAAACGKFSVERFTPLAAQLIAWTQKKLPRRALDFVGDFPLVLTGEGFRCAHGDFGDPSAFNYILAPGDAQASWNAAAEPLLFVGHSHTPAIHLIGASGTPHRIDAQDFSLEPGKRYIVNVGSVGHPRDGDLRACYVIHDTATGSVHFRRIPFDLDLYRAAMQSAGLPIDAAVFDRDPLERLAHVREDALFALNPGSPRGHDITPAQEISRYKTATRRWRNIALISLPLALLAIAVAVLVPRLMPRAEHNTSGAVITIPAQPLAPFLPSSDADNLLPPIPYFADGSLPGWRCAFASSQQRLTTQHAFPEPAIRLDAPVDTPHYFRIESPPVQITRELQRATFRGVVQSGENFNGAIYFTIEELGEADANGNYPVLRRDVKTPSRKSKADPTLATQFTTSKKFLANTRYLRVMAEGETSGVFTLTTFTLTPPDNKPSAK